MYLDALHAYDTKKEESYEQKTLINFFLIYLGDSEFLVLYY